jgi:hypothetical protein
MSDVEASRRAQAVVSRLALPDPSAAVLTALGRLELDRDAAAEARAQDEHGRLGALSWRTLTQLLPEPSTSPPDVVLRALTDWGLVQVVGQEPNDPVLLGSAACRLTYSGRATLGLAPAPLAPSPPSEPDAPSPWEVWHGAGREGLMTDALEVYPAAFVLGPLILRGDELRGASLCGRVAERLCADGVVVIDGTLLEHPKHGWVVEELLWRTARARGERVLLLTSPSPARVAAMVTGARLRWRELPAQTRRDAASLDPRVTERLMQGAVAHSQADACGVPDSELAQPRRVKTRWEDLQVPEPVQRQLQQALMHARYRLVPQPDGRESLGYRLLLSGLPGTGKSMAAEALASTLGRPVMKLDLSSVLSKWLGETERFLSQIFEIAEISGAVLVLDEADSLFRQRDSSGSGRDGLVTVVSYLLARLDRFVGLLVATTNRTRDLDEAFFRRFDDFIVLPVPDPATRRALWRQQLALETEGPEVELGLLADRFALSGGLIRCAATRARAWSSGMGLPMSTAIVLASLSRELEKSDRDPKEVLIDPHRGAVEQLLRGSSRWLEREE